MIAYLPTPTSYTIEIFSYSFGFQKTWRNLNLWDDNTGDPESIFRIYIGPIETYEILSIYCYLFVATLIMAFLIIFILKQKSNIKPLNKKQNT